MGAACLEMYKAMSSVLRTSPPLALQILHPAATTSSTNASVSRCRASASSSLIVAPGEISDSISRSVLAEIIGPSPPPTKYSGDLCWSIASCSSESTSLCKRDIFCFSRMKRSRVGEMGAPPAPVRRMSWTPDLARLFDEAVESLGGIDSVTPSSIKSAMGADLTIGNIKSRLQKLRLLRRAASCADQSLEISMQLDAELGKMRW